MSDVRVRFAPSPTGPLHIGGVRTALYNYLFAKKHGGKFIIRIEDTDQARYVEGAEEYIQKTFDWLGIAPDESPWNGGPYIPYRQSERKELYHQYALGLVEKGLAYYAFDTSEEIEQMKEKLIQSGITKPQYNSATRTRMKNSLTMSESEVREALNVGTPHVIRIKVPAKLEIRFKDQIRDWVVVHASTIDDKVLIKSDGMPTYHMANVVDDYLMKITHVIRGEEWLPSAPVHVLLYRFLGWENEMPAFAHLPLLLKPDGNGKLSKRDSEKHGFPLFPMEWNDKASGETFMGFREEGYLPSALINFLAFLGWNPGTEQELFSLSELIDSFGLQGINKSGARFDIEKAKWFNGQYLKAEDDDILAEYVLKGAAENGFSCSPDYARKVVFLLKQRVLFPKELFYNARYMFVGPTTYDEKVTSKKWTAEVVTSFEKYASAIEKVENISPEEAKNTLEKVLTEQGTGIGKVMQALRVSITGEASGPELMDIISVLGCKETAKRIRESIQKIPIAQ